MTKAEKLMKILSHDYTQPIEEKYAKVIIQVATLEEKIKALISLGFKSKAYKINNSIIYLIEEIKKEYERDQKR